MAAASRIVVSDVPARLDRLPWSRFHWLVLAALGITWILDGLEVTLAGSLAGALRDDPGMRLSAAQVGFANSCYLAGAVIGAIGFGWLTDRMGRKRLFSVTLGLYLLATAATGFSWDLASFATFRFLTGAGIGGEYSAINSAIQELIPARRRGWTDLAINGSFWVGAGLAAAGSIVLLDPALIPVGYGWRAAFLIGAAIGLVILLLRHWLPESPRWLVIHGREDEADAIVRAIEQRIEQEGHRLPPVTHRARIRSRRRTAIGEVMRTLIFDYPARTALGLVLMAAQAFCYNAIFFTYAMMLTDFYDVPSGSVGLYVLPFAAGNVLGALLLGRLFDTIGRRPMLVFTYLASAVLLAATGFLFRGGALDATSQTIAWSATFFFASAAASAAYLTVSESFPLETRALAIALFYSFGTGLGGVAAPWLFGMLIESGSRDQLLGGYLLGAGLMAAAGLLALALAHAAERKPLEEVARPLSWES